MVKIDQTSMVAVYPCTPFGILRVENFSPTPQGLQEFQKIKNQEIAEIRKKYSAYDRKEFSKKDPIGSHYVRYYKKFNKTYHVMHQLESILRGQEIQNGNPLVQILFLTELKHSILIACHDMDLTEGELTIGISREGETFLGAGEREVRLKDKDIILKDQKNILISIIYGQDHHTRITGETKNALYVVDGVPGLSKDAVEKTLEDITEYLHILDPQVKVVDMKIIEVSG